MTAHDMDVGFNKLKEITGVVEGRRRGPIQEPLETPCLTKLLNDFEPVIDTNWGKIRHDGIEIRPLL